MLAPQGEFSVRLRYKPPYDWPAMRSFLAQRAIAGIETVTEQVYSRTIELDGMQGTLSVRPGDDQALVADIRIARLATLPHIIARLRRQFDLAADPLRIAEHLRTDPLLAPLLRRRPGLRVPGAWDGFELAIRAVLGQQVTVAAAIRLAGTLVAAYGSPLASPQGALTHLFPTPAALVRADLGMLGMPRRRAATLRSVAAAALADPDLFGARCDLEQAVARLRAIPGVGEWTAQYIALRQLREPDAFPAADSALLRALSGSDGQRPTAAAVLARARGWRPWRAYAAQHLWASGQAVA